MSTVSASIHTKSPTLALAASGRPDATEQIKLPAGPALERFARATAEAGLGIEEAVRLALERWLTLEDASAFRIDVEAIRTRLSQAAGASRPTRALGAGEAAHLRELNYGRRRAVAEVGEGLLVSVPERLLTRVRGGAALSALDAGAVEEMVAWEVAAVLEGRTMAEWALHTLAGRAAA